MTDSVLRDPVLRDLESGERAEGEHIVNDMRQRAIRSGSDATLLTLAWIHLPARVAGLAREKRNGKKKSLI